MQVLINRTNILMAKEQETDTDAGGRGRPQADGRGRPREEPTRPNPACNPAPDGIDACSFRLGLWGLPGCLGAPTQKTTKASLLSPRGGVDFKRLLITSMLDRVSVVLFCLFLSWEFYSNFRKIYTCTHTQQSGKVQEVVNFCVL